MEGAPGNGIDPGELREAIAAGRLRLYFQPIVALADRSATMLEALPRWTTARRGILAPADFIELAESSGLLDELESWAIGATFRQLSRWDSGVAAELSISLNLSERHLYETDLAAAVEAAAEEFGVPAGRIGFEIDETSLVGAGGRSLEKLRALADLGVALTIDDYAGRVSPELLGELPTTALKISREIVAGIPDDRSRVQAATEAVDRGRALGLELIASGIEGPGQLASLRDLGCKYGQGFLISLPMPAEVLEERMAPR